MGLEAILFSKKIRQLLQARPSETGLIMNLEHNKRWSEFSCTWKIWVTKGDNEKSPKYGKTLLKSDQ